MGMALPASRQSGSFFSSRRLNAGFPGFQDNGTIDRLSRLNTVVASQASASLVRSAAGNPPTQGDNIPVIPIHSQTLQVGESSQRLLITQLINSLVKFTESLSTQQLLSVSSSANVWSAPSTPAHVTNVNPCVESINTPVVNASASSVPELCYKEVLPFFHMKCLRWDITCLPLLKKRFGRVIL